MKSQTRLSVRSINQSNRSISVRLSFLFCLRVFISRSYENRSNNEYIYIYIHVTSQKFRCHRFHEYSWCSSINWVERSTKYVLLKKRICIYMYIYSSITENCFYFLTTSLVYRQFLPTFLVVCETTHCVKVHYRERETEKNKIHKMMFFRTFRTAAAAHFTSPHDKLRFKMWKYYTPRAIMGLVHT